MTRPPILPGFTTRVWRSLALAGLLIVWLAPIAQAQDAGGVSLSARAGFDGYCKENNWLPVRVTLENDGPDLNGRIEVRQARDDGSTVLFTSPIDLPTVSRKEVFLHIFPENLVRALQVYFVADGRDVAETSVDLTCMADNNLLYGVLASSPSAFNVLTEVKPANRTAAVAQLQPGDLPDRAQALKAIDALVVSDVDTGVLTPAQREALSGWLAGGGRLIVAGGAGWQKTAAGLRDWLPLMPENAVTVSDLKSMQMYAASPASLIGSAVIATGGLRADAEALASQADFPIVARRRVGFGEVYFLAADPSLEPLRGWDGAGDLFRTLLLSALDRPSWSNGFRDWYAAENAVNALPGMELPSTSLICGFLGLYVVVVGPLNYFALRVLKRRELAWLTIPGLVIAFSASAFVVGSQARGNQVILNRLTIVNVWPGAESARVDGLLGVFSPYRASYQLDLESGWLARPIPSGAPVALSSDTWTLVEQDDGLSVSDLRIEVGGVNSLVVEGQVPAPDFAHNLTLDLGDQGATLRGELTNTASFALQDAVLLGPGTAQPIGDLQPGDTRAVQMPLQVASVSGSPGGSLAGDSTIADIVGSNSYYSSDRNLRRRFDLLQAATVPRNFNFSTGRGGGFYLAGWSDASPLALTVAGSTPASADTTLYVFALAPEFVAQTEQLAIPPGLFIWNVIEAAPGASASAYNGELYRDTYTLRFSVVRPIRFASVESLTLHLESYGDVGPVGPTLSLWDFAGRDWIILSGLRWGDNPISDPARYVSPGGEIRLRLRSASTNRVPIELSDFTLVVRR